MGNLLLGVCGSVACYKAAELVRLLSAHGWSVRVAMTPAAQEFVAAATFRALSGRAVMTDEWRNPLSAEGMDHIIETRAARAMLIAPASADFLAKAACGIADNTLLSAFLAADCPRFVAPAMNQQMWAAAATKRNIRRLREDGVTIIGPDSGEQACGEHGWGRLSSPPDIVAELDNILRAQLPLTGKQVVVSTGATVEAIDSMRIISNRSSGKMGFCLAQAAFAAGAQVQVVAANTTAPPPPGIPLRRAVSGDEMQAALMEECGRADIFFSAAAVADYRPTTRISGKNPRQRGKITLSLQPTEDILAAIAKNFPSLYCIGFAAYDGETDEGIAAARKKMQAKGADLMVANHTATAGGDNGEWTVVSEEEVSPLPQRTKSAAAAALVSLVAAKVSYETAPKTRQQKQRRSA